MKTNKLALAVVLFCLMAPAVRSNSDEQVWIKINPFPGGSNVWIGSSEPGFLSDLNKNIYAAGAPQLLHNDSNG
jgi:hypothetical protein